jgi:hypothetical protein
MGNVVTLASFTCIPYCKLIFKLYSTVQVASPLDPGEASLVHLQTSFRTRFRWRFCILERCMSDGICVKSSTADEAWPPSSGPSKLYELLLADQILCPLSSVHFGGGGSSATTPFASVWVITIRIHTSPESSPNTFNNLILVSKHSHTVQHTI